MSDDLEHMALWQCASHICQTVLLVTSHWSENGIITRHQSNDKYGQRKVVNSINRFTKRQLGNE